MGKVGKLGKSIITCDDCHTRMSGRRGMKTPTAPKYHPRGNTAVTLCRSCYFKRAEELQQQQRNDEDISIRLYTTLFNSNAN